MKRLPLQGLIAASLLAATCIGAPAFAETRSYDLKGFTRIEASKGYAIEFTQGPTFSVTVDSKYNDFDIIRVQFDGDTLRIDRPHTDGLMLNREVDDTVRITAPSLSDIHLSAGVSFVADALKVRDLNLNAESGTRFLTNNIDADKLDLKIRSGSMAKIAGTCGTATVSVASGSGLKASDLNCRDVEVHAFSASTALMRAANKIVASANSVSTIRVSGKPAVIDKTADRMSQITLDN